MHLLFAVGISWMRAMLLRLRGAIVGAKVSIDSGCRFVRAESLTLGQRVTLEQFVYLKCVTESARLTLGSWSFLGRGVEVDCQGSINIGEHVLISPGCFITDHNHGIIEGKRIDQQACTVGDIRIEDDVWVGANAVILPAVTIGRGAVVGAGAVVSHDVAANTIVAGVPARVIGHRK